MNRAEVERLATKIFNEIDLKANTTFEAIENEAIRILTDNEQYGGEAEKESLDIFFENFFFQIDLLAEQNGVKE